MCVCDSTDCAYTAVSLHLQEAQECTHPCREHAWVLESCAQPAPGCAMPGGAFAWRFCPWGKGHGWGPPGSACVSHQGLVQHHEGRVCYLLHFCLPRGSPHLRAHGWGSDFFYRLKAAVCFCFITYGSGVRPPSSNALPS